MRPLAVLLLCLITFAAAGPACAHKPSDSFLTLRLQDRQVTGQWDIALRDLDFALTLDADGDGAIRWSEVRARRAKIETYALSSLTLTADDQACWLANSDLLIDQHSDGAYAVLMLRGACPTRPQRVGVTYRLFADLDPQHRGLVHVTAGGQDQTLMLGVARPRQILALTGWGRLREFGDFVWSGVLHIWTGYDHLLFLISLLLPAVLTRQDGRWVAQARMRSAAIEVLRVVSAFTIAHSVTLSLAALGVLTIPARLTESLIALSVAVAALNNLRPVLTRRIWAAALVFGLIHGFGFANVLRDLGLPRTHLLTGLLGFNLGVELGQIAVVALVMPAAWLARSSGVYRRWLLPYGSLAIVLVALVWLVQRALGVSLV